MPEPTAGRPRSAISSLLNLGNAVRLADGRRLQALRATELLATPPEAAFDRVTRMVARALNCPIAAIALVDERTLFFKSSLGIPEPWASTHLGELDRSIARQIVSSGAPFVAGDLRVHPELAGTEPVLTFGVRAYLGVPLLAEEEQVIGVLCVMDRKLRAWTEADIASMEDHAACIHSEIQVRQRARAVQGIGTAAALDIAQQLESIVSAQREVMQCGTDLEQVMNVAVQRAMDLTQADGAVLELHEGAELVCRAVTGSASPVLGLRMKPAGTLSGQCSQESKTIICSDTELDPRVDRQACRRLATRSVLMVPLPFQRDNLGVLQVVSRVPGVFDERAAATLEFLAGSLAAAMAHARANSEVQASEQRFRSLAELASDGIFCTDASGKIVFWNHCATKVFGYTAEQIMGEPLSQLLPEHFAADPRTALTDFERRASDGTRNRALEFTGRRADGKTFPLELSISTWVRANERFYTAIARDITERKRLETTLQELARTDYLTGLLTRRAGEEAIAREVSRSRRYSRPLSFVLLDLDHFKRVNDGFGHACGDRVLHGLGTLIQERLRASDLAVRWGGEEVLLVLPETGRDGAVAVSEFLRKRLSEQDFEGVGPVTMSAGVAELAPGESGAEAISRADTKLYQSKAEGRNRVSV